VRAETWPDAWLRERTAQYRAAGWPSDEAHRAARDDVHRAVAERIRAARAMKPYVPPEPPEIVNQDVPLERLPGTSRSGPRRVRAAARAAGWDVRVTYGLAADGTESWACRMAKGERRAAVVWTQRPGGKMSPDGAWIWVLGRNRYPFKIGLTALEGTKL
jgi:hypothetical protein